MIEFGFREKFGSFQENEDWAQKVAFDKYSNSSINPLSPGLFLCRKRLVSAAPLGLKCGTHIRHINKDQ